MLFIAAATAMAIVDHMDAQQGDVEQHCGAPAGLVLLARSWGTAGLTGGERERELCCSMPNPALHNKKENWQTGKCL